MDPLFGDTSYNSMYGSGAPQLLRVQQQNRGTNTSFDPANVAKGSLKPSGLSDDDRRANKAWAQGFYDYLANPQNGDNWRNVRNGANGLVNAFQWGLPRAGAFVYNVGADIAQLPGNLWGLGNYALGGAGKPLYQIPKIDTSNWYSTHFGADPASGQAGAVVGEFGLPVAGAKAVKGMMPVINGVVSNGTKAVKGVTGKAVNGIRDAGRSIVTKGKTAVKNVADAQKQWRGFRTAANQARNTQSFWRNQANTLAKELRGAKYSQRGTLGKTWDLIKNPKQAIRTAWHEGKWHDRFRHPIQNTRQWWRYSNSGFRHPIQNLKNSFGYTTDVYKYIGQGKGFVDKAKRLGTVGLDAGKKAGKVAADAGISQAIRIGVDDAYNKAIQQVYADQSLTQQQRVDKMNALQRRRRGLKAVAGTLISIYGPTKFSKLVGGTAAAQGGFAPAIQAGIQAKLTDNSFFDSYWHPYAVKGKQNLFSAARQAGVRYGDTSMFNHYLQRAGGDLGQGWFYGKVGPLTGIALQQGLAAKFGGGINPFQWSDRSNIQRVQHAVQPITAVTTGVQNRIAQINNNPHLTDQQKAAQTKPLQDYIQDYRKAIEQRGQAINKGRLLNAITGDLSDQNAYVALSQIGNNIVGRYAIRPFVQSYVDNYIKNTRDLANAIAAAKDPARRDQLIKKLVQRGRWSPLVQQAALEAAYKDPAQSVRRAAARANITPQDLRTMAAAQSAAYKSGAIQNGEGSQFTRNIIQQYGIDGATAHYADLVQKAAKDGNVNEFKNSMQVALDLMNMFQSTGNSQHAARLKKTFQANMVPMIRKDPSLIPWAIGLGIGSMGMPGLGGFVAQNPLLALGGVGALFALPSLVGGLRDSFNSQNKAAPQAVAQSQPQVDLYATTLRRG